MMTLLKQHWTSLNKAVVTPNKKLKTNVHFFLNGENGPLP